MFEHGQRPDLLVCFGKNGHEIAYDLTIVNPVRDDAALNRALRDEQGFLAADEQTKINKYRDECAKRGKAFCPIVLGAFGGIPPASYMMGIVPPRSDNSEEPILCSQLGCSQQVILLATTHCNCIVGW